MNKFLTLATTLSLSLILSFNSNADNENVSIIGLTFKNRTTNGVVMLDENENSYFVDYGSLESAGIKNIEETNSILVEINEYGEILKVK